MVSRYYISLGAFVCTMVIAFRICTASSDEPRKPPTPASSSSSESSCTKIKFKKLSNDSILITSGFSYNRDLVLGSPLTVIVDDIFAGEILIPSKDSVIVSGAEDAVGVKWQFAKAGLTFRRGGCSYSALKKNASIEFQKDGVLVTGFKTSQRTSK